MFYTTSCRGHKITVICGFTIVSHVQEFFSGADLSRAWCRACYKAAVIQKHREIPDEVYKAKNTHSPFFYLAFRKDKPEASVSTAFRSAELHCNRGACLAR